MFITSFLVRVGYHWAMLNDQTKSTGTLLSSAQRHKKLASYRPNETLPFREMPGIHEQAVSLNAQRGRAHRSVLSVP
jgi:hypothetical protein